jgi:hypothetical protein
MTRFNFRSVLLCAVALLSVTGMVTYVLMSAPRGKTNNSSARTARMQNLPKVILWAWERSEDLQFLEPREVGIAYLASTIQLRGDRLSERPRLNPLKVREGTPMIAVVRIESDRELPATLSQSQRAEIIAALIRVATIPNLSALQIDFDASESQRPAYRSLLQELRAQLPDSMPLSITALASWCMFDNWVDGLPIDEAVPMLFRMGLDEERIESHVESGGKMRARICRSSLGISTDEPMSASTSAVRTYIFNPKPWTEMSARSAIKRSLNVDSSR